LQHISGKYVILGQWDKRLKCGPSP